jgi:hypothetical protein
LSRGERMDTLKMGSDKKNVTPLLDKIKKSFKKVLTDFTKYAKI